MPEFNHQVAAVRGVMEEECSALLKSFFKELPHYHVRIPLQNGLTELWRLIGRIGVVAVCHDIALCVNLTEHTPYDVPLSLLILIAHHRACGHGSGGQAFVFLF